MRCWIQRLFLSGPARIRQPCVLVQLTKRSSCLSYPCRAGTARRGNSPTEAPRSDSLGHTKKKHFSLA
ncbi:hypothetical protein DPEC_G00022130 [Dallia pectoralis]|uniref:Uncharacterized protein n=1 Tax=Dallia pectoralis TaxID=75939 RepID=A0ACC2HGU2_DALPE|nr:hypothetical protein DPEC_G00022130 [Dallia pectoralis]